MHVSILPLLALQAVLLSLMLGAQPVHAVLDQAEHFALFKQAVLEKNEMKMKDLLQPLVPTYQFRDVIHACIMVDNTEYLRFYLQNTESLELNRRDLLEMTPLMQAYQYKRGDHIKILLEMDGLDINAVGLFAGRSTLMWAIRGTSVEQFEQFLAYARRSSTPLNVNHHDYYGYSFLFYLRDETDVKVRRKRFNLAVEYIIDRIKILDVQLLAPLLLETDETHFITIWRNLTPENQRKLMQSKDWYRLSLLCYVNSYNEEILAEWLKIPEINVNVRCIDHTFMTPLMLSAKAGQWSKVRLLMNYPGTKVNMHDADGNTALLYAARHEDNEGKRDIVEVLSKRSDRDEFGRTGMDNAIALNNLELMEIYKERVYRRFLLHEKNNNTCSLRFVALYAVAKKIAEIYAPTYADSLAKWLVEKACKTTTASAVSVALGNARKL